MTVLSYSECKIVKIFRNSILHATGEDLQRQPRFPRCLTVFHLATFVEKPPPKKNCWIRQCIQFLLGLVEHAQKSSEINQQYVFFLKKRIGPSLRVFFFVLNDAPLLPLGFYPNHVCEKSISQCSWNMLSDNQIEVVKFIFWM